MAGTEKTRFSDSELQEFKEIILKKIDKAERDLDLLREQFANDKNNGTDDTSPQFKSFEEGSSVMSKERSMASLEINFDV